MDFATTLSVGTNATGGSPVAGTAALLAFENVVDRGGKFYMGTLSDGSSFDGNTHLVLWYNLSNSFAPAWKVDQNGNIIVRPLLPLEQTVYSQLINGGESVMHLKSSIGAASTLIALQNTEATTTLHTSAASPNGVISANPGALSPSLDGNLYVKEAGTGTNQDWSPVATGLEKNAMRAFHGSRTLPAAGSTVDIGILNASGGGGIYAEIALVVNNGAGSAIAKRYQIVGEYDATNSVWQNVLPVSSGGDYFGDDFKLEIKSNTTRDSLRVRKVSGALSSTLYYSIQVYNWVPGVNSFTPRSVTTTNPAAVTDVYIQQSLTSTPGRVGINVLDPLAPLDVRSLAPASTSVMRVASTVKAVNVFASNVAPTFSATSGDLVLGPGTAYISQGGTVYTDLATNVASVQEFKAGESITAGVGINYFVVPPALAGFRITEFSLNVAGGTGDITVQLSVGGASSNGINVVAPGGYTTSTSRTLAAGDIVRLNTSVATSGLSGLSATFTITK
jgi:hypothetical protein